MKPMRHGLALCLAGWWMAGCMGSVGTEEEGGGEPTGGTETGSTAPGAGPSTQPSGFTPAAMNVTPIEARVWRLTRRQIDNSLVDLLGDRSNPAGAIDQ